MYLIEEHDKVLSDKGVQLEYDPNDLRYVCVELQKGDRCLEEGKEEGEESLNGVRSGALSQATEGLQDLQKGVLHGAVLATRLEAREVYQ